MTNPHASLVRVFRLVRTAECFTTVRKLRLSTRMTGGQWTSFICSGWATEEPLRRQPGRISRCWQNDFSRTTAFFQPSSLASLAITWRHQHHVGGRVQCPEQHQWQIEQSGCGARRRGLHPFIETRWLRDSDSASSGTGRSARALATTGEGRSRGALPPTHRKGVAMTYGSLHVSAIALSMAAFVSISPLSTAHADPSAPGAGTPSLNEPGPTPRVATTPPNGTAPTPGAGTPSLSEPAPTPSVATAPSNGTAPTPGAGTPSLSEPAPTPSVATTDLQRPSHAGARRTHAAWRNGHRSASYRYDRNPVAAAATGVVGGMATLGSVAAYPIYCFPHYGSCRLYRPHP